MRFKSAALILRASFRKKMNPMGKKEKKNKKGLKGKKIVCNVKVEYVHHSLNCQTACMRNV